MLKNRLKKNGKESVTNCNQLKPESEDCKFKNQILGNLEDISRLIQSISSTMQNLIINGLKSALRAHAVNKRPESKQRKLD